MKILLIYPYFLETRIQAEDIQVVPIGVYYVGAALKANHYDVEILNWHDIHKVPEQIEKVLREKRPRIIGFSILHANRWGGIEIARIAKTVDPEVKVVFGGIGATFLWEHFLTHFPEVDFVVMGEGEHSFLQLAREIEKGNDTRLGNIKGIAYRESGKPVRTQKAELVEDLDTLPDPSIYFDFCYVSSTRGCPGNCTFCGSPRFWGRRVRFHSPDYFVDQLERLHKRGINFFYFSDDTFTIKKERVIKICRKILERRLDIVWAAISRVNSVGEDVLRWMRKAGCIQISYGVESGSEKIRQSLNKNISQDQIKKAFQLTVKYGILTRAYFIYGSPREDQGTIQQTIQLVHEIKPLSIIFYVLDIFPGTGLYEDFKRQSGTTDDIWLNKVEDIMYFQTDPRLTEERILSFGNILRTTFYRNIRSYIEAIELVDEKEFYSLHADFLSRLGMTFSHGDYAQIEAIEEKGEIARSLYRRALSFSPDHRAFLGLGIIEQKEGRFQESIRLLTQGITYFPDSEELCVCLGISYLNIGQYRKALSCFSRFEKSKDCAYYMAVCYQAMGEPEKASTYMSKYRALA